MRFRSVHPVIVRRFEGSGAGRSWIAYDRPNIEFVREFVDFRLTFWIMFVGNIGLDRGSVEPRIPHPECARKLARELEKSPEVSSHVGALWRRAVLAVNDPFVVEFSVLWPAHEGK